MSGRTGVVVVLSSMLLMSSSAMAEPREPAGDRYAPPSIASSGAWHVEAMMRQQERASVRSLSQQAPPSRSFIKRHPVWSGMLIGLVAGTVIAERAAGNEAAGVGLYGGAAIGAGAGWLLSR